MKTVIAIVMLVLACLPARAQTRPESFTVNGLKVIFKQSTATEIIAANMYFRGGVAVPGLRQAGIERLALIVATRATKNYPKDMLSTRLERMNTRLGSTAGPDYSSVTMQCVKQNFAESWKIFTDVLLNPLFDSADVELERARTLSAIRQVRDNPDQYLGRLGIEAYYNDHPYAIDPAGTERTVTSFTPQDLRAWVQGRLTGSQILLVVVGNTTRGVLEQMVQSSFSGLQPGSFKPPAPLQPVHAAPSIKVVKRELPTHYISGLYPAPAFGSDESYPMLVARSILGDRLFEEVRTKRGLSYAPAAVPGGMFTNYHSIYVTAVKPETTIAVMVNELRRLKEEAVPAKTLSDKKNIFLTGYYLSVETNSSQAETLARHELGGKGFEESARFVENIRSVTPEAVQEVCRKYIQNLQFVLIGNPTALQLTPFMF